MELQLIPLIIVVAYLVGMLIVGFVVGKLHIKDSKDYRLHYRPGPEGLRRLGYERRLVCAGGVDSHDPAGIFCAKNP